jgi:APA family basic amino acid/polyamine antiporter/amino acid efflux transporter
LTEIEQEVVLPKRSVNLSTGILYGIGCGIGGSVFVLLGTAIERAQSGVLISLILGGVLIFFTALNYSELSTSLPVSGGDYNFSKEALGGFLAFIIGFFLWIANIATFSFSAHAFFTVIEAFFPLPFMRNFFIIIAIISILFTAFIVFRSQKIALKTVVSLTVVLLFIFSIFIISGFLVAPIQNAPNYDVTFLSSDTNFFSVILMFSLLFIFFTGITSNLAYLNADLKNPSKNIPKTNIFAILITLFIYISITIVVMINIGNNPTGLGDSPILLALILNNILGFPGYLLMGIAATISTFIAMNAALGSAVSVMHALARDHYVSQKMLKVNKKTQVPILPLIMTTGIAIFFTILAITFSNIGFTANITTFIYFFGLAFVNFAAVSLRYKRKELDRPFKAPFFPYLPIIIGSSCLILAFAVNPNPNAVILGVIIFVIGITYYLLTLADRHSIVFTIGGLKTFAVILLGFFIWILNNLGTLNSPIQGFTATFSFGLLRILIFICIFTIGTIFLDIMPLKELVYFFTKRMSRKEVAIDIGVGRIIELKKSKSSLIYNINIVIGIIQIASSLFIFSLIALITFNIISIESIIFGSIIVPQNTGEFLFVAFLMFLGILLLFSGPLNLYLNRETKTFGI